LDRTCFYPTSGGQRHDNGRINDVPVQDVYARDADGAVVHLLAERVRADQVQGAVDWPTRFDHMQQHTGQHILSQAFVQVAQATTVGFHMSAKSSSLDLDVEQLPAEKITEAESLSNEIVWENRPVTVRFVDATEAQRLPLRKIPEAKDGMLRVVAIDSFDISACGGTHVARAGEVGLIKVINTERLGGKCRIEFLCGRRALTDYDRKNMVLQQLSGEMTTGYWELEKSIAKLREELKSARRSLKQKTNQLNQAEAENLVGVGSQFGDVLLIRKAFKQRDPQELRALAGRLAKRAKTIVLIGLSGKKAQLIFARSDDIEVSMNTVLQDALPLLGDASGGGSAKFAQGGGQHAGEQQILEALHAGEHIVRTILIG
jgi:alanyl-tRNA synthetase